MGQVENEARLNADITKLKTAKDAVVARVAAYSQQIKDLLAKLEATEGKGLSEAATNALFDNLEPLTADMDKIAQTQSPSQGVVAPPAPLPKPPTFPSGV